MNENVSLPQLELSLSNAGEKELEELIFLMEHPEYETRPLTMREFLENPNFVPPQDAPRPYNKQLLIDIFDSYRNENEFENLGRYEEAMYIAGIGSGKSYFSSMSIVYCIYRLLFF